MSSQKLNRRQLTAGCAALGLSLASTWRAWSAAAIEGPSEVTAKRRSVRLPDGTMVPALGQGAWHLGQNRHPAEVETQAIQAGIALGMTLIDTSGNYGDGRSEEFLKPIVAADRSKIFLVSKVERNEIEGDGIERACAASLARLGTSYLDLYLMHWPVATDQLAHIVSEFERLRASGKIRSWGVSNFSKEQMADLFAVPEGPRCTTVQIPYSLNNRHIEDGVLPWCEEHKLPVMAYSPLGGDHNLLVNDPTLADVGKAHGCSAAAVALAWVIRGGNIIAIPESGAPEHTRANAVALTLALTPAELERLDKAFPGPRGAA